MRLRTTASSDKFVFGLVVSVELEAGCEGDRVDSAQGPFRGHDLRTRGHRGRGAHGRAGRTLPVEFLEPNVNMISFTGSTLTGRKVMRLHLTRRAAVNAADSCPLP